MKIVDYLMIGATIRIGREILVSLMRTDGQIKAGSVKIPETIEFITLVIRQSQKLRVS